MTFAIAPAVFLSAGPRYVVFDEDNDHYFKQPASFMDERHLEEYVDRIAAGGKVTHVFFCPTGGRASFDSKTWEPIWRGLDEYPEGKAFFLHERWAKNAKALFDKGIDPYQVFIRRCREKGISPWLSPRMNDGHDGAQFHRHRPYRSTTFWREHREFHFDPTCEKGDWALHSLDYRHPEVRNHALAMIRELFERYDMDGLNLIGRLWFPQEHATESVPIMDAFLDEVVKLRDEWSRKRGHRILLGTFASATPDKDRKIGYDVARYVREGKLDWIVCHPFGFDGARWRQEIAPRTDAVIVLKHPNVFGSGKGLPNYNPEAAELRGWADVTSSWPIDGYYFFNVEYSPRTQFELCRRGVLPVDLPRVSRFYRLGKRGSSLPLKMDKTLDFSVGVATTNGASSILFGFADKAPFGLDVRLNGVSAVWEHEESVSRRRFEENARGREVVQAFCYQGRRCHFPAGTVRTGENTVEIGPAGADFEITFMELQLEP